MSSTVLPTDYQNFIHVSRYSRWIEEDQRRETWPETVERYLQNIVVPRCNDEVLIKELRKGILNLDYVPSMRALMTAGKAADRDNTCLYNCSNIAIDSPRVFDEAMFILLCGTGVGFSCERQYVEKLPEIPAKLEPSQTCILVKDSKEGWARAFRHLISMLYDGDIPSWDVSQIRPKGARLKTFGGRASGPAPLVDLFNFTVEVFTKAAGRKLTSFEAHSIMTKVGDIVVVGGVRRSAMLSLSNLQDDEMRYAKSGNWYEINPHLRLANNSVAYTRKPDAIAFLREWTALAESGSGERGIYNRQAAINQAKKTGRRDYSHDFGTNPCGEISLRNSGQFCNLTEVCIRSTDTKKDLLKKVHMATILGTIQATYTYFPYLRKVWKNNTEEERLLGVSLTGIMDNVLTNGTESNLPDLLERLKGTAVNTNKLWSAKLGIPQSAAVTTVKPSGTVSQLCSTGSGIHPRHSEYYIRTVRGDNNDPLTSFLKDQGIPSEPCVYEPDTTTVFNFPMQSPKGAVLRDHLTAIQQLEMWMIYQEHWVEHNVSITVTVRPHEWIDVASFVYSNFEKICGVSFLPHSDHTYQQAPYQEIHPNEIVYKTDQDGNPTDEISLHSFASLTKLMPDKIEWDKFKEYENEDGTTGAQQFACSGDQCEIVDIGA